MVLQIKNDKVLSLISDLDSVLEPKNGDSYFIDEDKKVHQYYLNPRSNVGAWSIDLDIIIYEKTKVLEVGFTDVTLYFLNATSFIDDERKLIDLRTFDGQEAYKLTLAEMRIQRLDNNIPHSVFNDNVYIPLASMINEIYKGGWISAYEDLNMTPTNIIFTEEMKKGFRLKLSTYIVQSGNYEEYSGKLLDLNGFIL